MSAPRPVRVIDPEAGGGVVLVGVGGTGGYVLQQLCRLAYGLNELGLPTPPITLIDGDTVEKKNLLRQYFLPMDLRRNKAEVLAGRYGRAYGLGISYVPGYVASGADLSPHVSDGDVVVGCVDNAATRAILHHELSGLAHVVYVDAGNAAADVPADPEHVDRYELAKIRDSGWGGQVVAGARIRNRQVIPFVGEVFPDMLVPVPGDPDDQVPDSEAQAACGVEAAGNPQRHLTNLVAATAVTGYLTTLLSEGTLVHHRTFFDARAGWQRSDAAENAMVEVRA